MCGIAGELRLDGGPPDLPALARMQAVLAPRGPEGSGVFAEGPIGFGHRRLKIIDTSDRAGQPMIDSALGLALVYNGAIYNYRELREELRERGYDFVSGGDTEVVLKAFHCWGPACVERFNGMFAFALWQRDAQRLFLARDRLGIKPLYLARTADRLRFASTLPALLAAGEVDTAIDPVALHHYMTFHAVVPAPHTILQGVRKLPPATRLEVALDGETRSSVFWRLESGRTPPASDGSQSAEGWREALHAALRAAVVRRMNADVPVGVLLSGGLDSSLVVALLAEAGQQDLKTFSIGFETVADEPGDEFVYSDQVAERFGTDHQRIRVDSGRALGALDACIGAMSEPMVSHDCIGFYLLSEEVSRHVKVVQSGQGADEVFGGYDWYPPLLRATDIDKEYAAVFFDRSDEEYQQVVHPRFAGEDHSAAFVAAHFAGLRTARPVDKAMHLDTTIMLVDDPVKRVDNMTMAFGLEARVPFLDHELLELAARMPAELKVGNGGKHILKEVGRSLLPHEVIDRPKGYFPVPALKYLRGPFLERVRATLQSDRARQRQLFRPEYVEQVLAAPDAHITRLRGSKLWQMALLESWLQIHGI